MTRQRALGAARGGFVLLTVAFAWWGFRGRWSEVGAAVTTTGPLRVVAAVGCAVAGLALTGLVWRLLTRSVGAEVGVRDASAIFFVGQLGKYVPGSVWTVVAQAHLGRRHHVPGRSSLTASAVFLGVHTATGLLLGGMLVAAGTLDGGVPDGLRPLPYAAAAAGLLALTPPVVRRLSERLAGRDSRSTFGAAELVRSLALMTATWLLYGGSLSLLVPGTGPDSPGFAAAVAAFALAHAVGVLVVFAPAGVGAREAVLVALLAPALGVPGAAAVALLSRLAHALADFVLAGAATAWSRAGRGVEPPEPARVGGH